MDTKKTIEEECKIDIERLIGLEKKIIKLEDLRAKEFMLKTERLAKLEEEVSKLECEIDEMEDMDFELMSARALIKQILSKDGTPHELKFIELKLYVKFYDLEPELMR